MQVGSIDTLFSQGNLETTGLNTDLAIQGDSFFVVAKGNQNYYTRAGNFQIDADGRLVSPTNGSVVQGRMADKGVLPRRHPRHRAAVRPEGRRQADRPAWRSGATSTHRRRSSPARSTPPVARTRRTPARGRNPRSAVYDSLGNQHDLKLQFWKTADDTWTWQVDGTNLPTGFTPDNATPQTLQFDTQGLLTAVAPTDPPAISFTPAGADPVSITLDLGKRRQRHHVVRGHQHGRPSRPERVRRRQLQSFSIDRTGVITGAFTNGTNEPLGQIALADFNNPGGLLAVGDNMYAESGNSGGAVLGYSAGGEPVDDRPAARWKMSNVDLAQEFTNMIVAERGFQANGKVITSSDEMLQEVVNLKR